MTRVKRTTTNTPTFRVGMGGNYYMFCDMPEPLHEICEQIGKSVRSVYYHQKHQCWVFRIRCKTHKNRILAFLES